MADGDNITELRDRSTAMKKVAALANKLNYEGIGRTASQTAARSFVWNITKSTV